MKKSALLLLLCLSASCLNAQVVIEVVDFDNPNDLSNRFYGMQSLVQIPSNGVTGGCLLTPDSSNWGNDNSRYCSRFDAQDTMEYQSSIMFFYSDSIINPNSFDRAVSVWFQPSTDPNHYVIGSLTHDKKLELLSYFSANSSAPVSMINNYWYELSLSVILHSDSLTMSLMLLDRGPNGQMPPLPSGFISSNIVDSVFARDNAIEVSISGSKNGGSIYLDKFFFYGNKSADSCLTSGISPAHADDIKIINGGYFLQINSNKPLNEKYEIYDLTGKKIQSGRITADDTIINLSGINAGNYLLRLTESNRTFKLNRFN